jgi:hypothetical protein
MLTIPDKRFEFLQANNEALETPYRVLHGIVTTVAGTGFSRIGWKDGECRSRRATAIGKYEQPAHGTVSSEEHEPACHPLGCGFIESSIGPETKTSTPACASASISVSPIRDPQNYEARPVTGPIVASVWSDGIRPIAAGRAYRKLTFVDRL